MTNERPYYGKFRGTVLNSVDTGFKGRITASVSVGGTPLQVVAEACTPYPGFYAIPPEGSGVWIEFEEGDLNRPIWTGCWWKDGELQVLLSPDLPPPTAATAPKTVVFSVAAAGFPGAVPMARLKLDATTGAATLETLGVPASPALPTAVKITSSGIEITLGTSVLRIALDGIDLNKGALKVLAGP